MSQRDVVIVSSARTPLGAFQGALAAVPAPRLGGTAIQGALLAGKVAPAEITDVFFGQVLQAGCGQAPARQAALNAKLPMAARCVTINKATINGTLSVPPRSPRS